MERLQRLAPDICRIGLSATIAPLKEVAHYLVGNEKGKERDCKIVNVSFLKKLDLKVISPLPSFINSTMEQTQTALYETLTNLIQSHKTTLIFTNTRSGTERLVHNLKDKWPELYKESTIGTHHSSLDRSVRFKC